MARHAGVSKTTVTNVMNGTGYVAESMRCRVEASIRELGYRPNPVARCLATKRSSTIAVYIDSRGFRDAFRGSLFATLMGFLREMHYQAMIVEAGEDADEHIEAAVKGMADGVIFLDVDDSVMALADGELIMRQFPAVAYGWESELSIPLIRPDFADGMRQAIRHLSALGHTDVTFIGPQGSEGNERLSAFFECCTAERLRPIMPKEPSFESAMPWSAAFGYLQMKSLVTDGIVPSAAMCGNDAMAIGAMKALVDVGVEVPDDMSIIGWDDVEAASYTNPTLTTVAIDTHSIADALTQTLVQLIEGHKKLGPYTVLILNRLVTRGSTSSPRQK